MLDERWIRALHVETMREEELRAERERHILFQASTIGALLDGAYDGDLRFGQLAEHGDQTRTASSSSSSRPCGSCRGRFPHVLVLGPRFAAPSAMGTPPGHATRGMVVSI